VRTSFPASQLLLGIAVLLLGVAFLDSRDGPSRSLAESIYRILLYAIAGLLSVASCVRGYYERKHPTDN